MDNNSLRRLEHGSHSRLPLHVLAVDESLSLRLMSKEV